MNAAINTANNAANTATIAQGIAVNANQNAATALDTAQTADGKAEAAQDAAEVADGKAEAAQDTADQNAANIGNLADLTTTAKNNLVAAINEAAQTGGGGTDDTKAPLIVDTASGAVASFSDGADNMQIQELVCTIEPVQAAGTPSPDNPLPISGHTGLILHAIGKNLFDGVMEQGGISNTDGQNYTAALESQIRSANYISIPSDTIMTISHNLPTFNNFYLYWYDENKSFLSYEERTITASNYTAQAPATAKYMRFKFYKSGDYPLPSQYNIQIEVGSAASSYSPYINRVIPITWQTEAGTVYVGYFDVVSGKLIVTHVRVNLGSIDWTFYNYSGFSGGYSGGLSQYMKVVYDYELPNALCSALKIVTDNTFNSRNTGSDIALTAVKTVKVTVPNVTDAATLKSALSGVMLVYELEQPIEYTLTPHKLTTLYGTNNIFTDVGPIQSCKYPADTKLYIDGKVAELQALILEN